MVSTDELEHMARFMRQKILEASLACNLSAHLGGGLSIVDITATLYGTILRFDRYNPLWEDRDRFILSKGHGVLGFYSALLAAGLISEEKFKTFQHNGSDLIAHPVMNHALGIESSNGSLGHGLSMAIGLALAAKRKRQDHKIYVLLGDGECNEGSVWESIMSAAQFKLDNLIAIIDYNRLQSDGDARQIMDLGDLCGKLQGFGWDACDVDGHDIRALLSALTQTPLVGKPRVLVAHTIKGKGIPFMENNNDWHHNRLTQANYERAIAQLGALQ